MDVPEITHDTCLESTPWQSGDSTLPRVKYIDHLTSYEDFFKNILLKNQLCVIGPHATSEWTSRRCWVEPDGSPDFAYLQETFGESVAPVADCSSEEFCSHSKTEMTVKDYLTYWQGYRFQGKGQEATKCLYLKDWHLARDYPDYHGYRAPSVLCSDWMNEFWDVHKDQDKTDDYRFVYMGPKGSWTPFHADVLHSYSWSANICGKKKWIFYPPGEERYVNDKRGQLVFDLRSPHLKDRQKYPDATSASSAAITVIQNPGEIIFVPSGWHHQVFNLEDTISINHNWMNGCSAHLSWVYIKKRLAAVQKEIEDCRDMEGWHQQCQVILKADSGVDYMIFYNFMATIAVHRIKALNWFFGGERSSGDLGCSPSLRLELSSSRGVGCDEDDYGPDGTRERARAGFVPEVGLMVSSQVSCSCLGEMAVRGKDFIGNMSGVSNVVGNVLKCDKNDIGNVSKCDKSDIGNVSECDKNVGRVRYLCLFKGKVVDKSVYGGDVTEHQTCPHWAHCGPNLAMFDLCQVVNIVRDMMKQDEFRAIMETDSSQDQFVIPPLCLVREIEWLVSRGRV